MARTVRFELLAESGGPVYVPRSMPTSQNSTTGGGAGLASADRAFFGHPLGLSTLFFTEMWERFSYYGMRAFLLLFMVTPVAAGGLGLESAYGGLIVGLYTSAVYLLSVP